MSRSNTQAQLNSKHCPILTLPPELVSEIFTRCLSHDTEDHVDFSEAPLLLTQICGTWRRVALSTLSLWARLSTEFDCLKQRLPEILEMWCARSPGPLSLRLFGAMGELKDVGALIETLGRHSHKIKTLELTLQPDDVWSLEGYDFEFSILQDLCIALDSQPDGINDLTISMFGRSPLLRKVELSNLPLPAVRLPLQNITVFMGDRYSTADCFDALRLLPNVTHCGFNPRDGNNSGELPNILHPNLPHLSLDFENASGEPFWRGLTLPCLETLVFYGPEVYGSHEDHFLAFLHRSSPPLRKLALWGPSRLHPPGVPSAQLVSKLQGLTDLIVLYPVEQDVSDFFDAFGSDPRLLPHLQRLSVGSQESGWREVDLGFLMSKAGTALTKRRTIISEGSERQLRSLRIGVERITPGPLKLLEELPLPLQELKQSGTEVLVGIGTLHTFLWGELEG